MAILAILLNNWQVSLAFSPGLIIELQEGSDCCSCPEKWIGYRCSCYLILNEEKTWAESRNFCASQNSSLLQLKSRDELDFLNYRRQFYWLGISYNETHGTWLWEDGSAPSQDLFSFFQTLDPKKCIVHSPNKEILDEPCGGKRPYICLGTPACSSFHLLPDLQILDLPVLHNPMSQQKTPACCLTYEFGALESHDCPSSVIEHHFSPTSTPRAFPASTWDIISHGSFSEQLMEPDFWSLGSIVPFVDGYFGNFIEKFICHRKYSANIFSRIHPRTPERLWLLSLPREVDWSFRISGGRYYWIGLTYNERRGAWLWEDGSALSRDLFPSFPPLNPQNCTVYKPRGTIVDQECKNKYGFICKHRHI
ncbi:uncharacterized protein LOC100661313 isoform X3 [Loxodonta africana]